MNTPETLAINYHLVTPPSPPPPVFVCSTKQPNTKDSSCTSTGKVRPGIVIAGQSLKYLVNRSACHRREKTKEAKEAQNPTAERGRQAVLTGRTRDGGGDGDGGQEFVKAHHVGMRIYIYIYAVPQHCSLVLLYGTTFPAKRFVGGGDRGSFGFPLALSKHRRTFVCSERTLFR